MRFNPSAQSYGYSDDPYAAQTMLRTWTQGRDVGDVYGQGFDPVTAIASAIGSGANLASTIVGAVHEGKQAKLDREHEIKMTKEEKKLLKSQAELAAVEAQVAAAEARRAHEESKTGVAAASWLGGSVITIALIGGLIYAAKQRRG